jgi:hypothetical protein
VGVTVGIVAAENLDEDSEGLPLPGTDEFAGASCSVESFGSSRGMTSSP